MTVVRDLDTGVPAHGDAGACVDLGEFADNLSCAVEFNPDTSMTNAASAQPAKEQTYAAPANPLPLGRHCRELAKSTALPVYARPSPQPGYSSPLFDLAAAFASTVNPVRFPGKIQE